MDIFANARRIHGLGQLALSVYRVYINYWYYIEYQKEGIAWLYKTSSNVLFLNIAFGVLGVFAGIQVLRNKMKVRTAYLIIFGGIIIGLICNLIKVI